MRNTFNRFKNQASLKAAEKQLAVAEMERRQAEEVAALADEQRKSQEKAALLERERIERQSEEKMAHELEEQRVLLEDRLRRAVEERDDQTKEVEARMKAKLAALEEEKERAGSPPPRESAANSADWGHRLRLVLAR